MNKTEITKSVSATAQKITQHPKFKIVLAVVVACALLAAFFLGKTLNANADSSKSDGVPELSSSEALLNETATYEKGEVVYSTLTSSGKVQASYVVNQFDVTVPGRIVDYGDYETVKNLSTEDELLRKQGATIFDVLDTGVFYYEGDTTSLELPWNVNIEYYLDDVRYADPSELGGKSGALEIVLTTSQNTKVDSAFYDSFLLQITFTIPAENCTNVEASGATIAASGSSRTIAFTALPGHDANCVLRADVENFKMDGVQIAALPYSSAITMPDTSSITSGFDELVAAVSLLEGGANDLSEGTSSLSSGLSQLSSGISQIDTEAIAAYAAKLSKLISYMPAALSGISVSESSLHATANVLNTVANILEFFKSCDEWLQERIISHMNSSGISIDLDTEIARLRAIANVLDSNAAEMVQLCNDLSDPSKVEQIKAQISQLSDGIFELQDGVIALSDGASQLASGMQSYADGMESFYGGVETMPETVASAVESMSAEYTFPEFVPQSIMSSKNTQIKSVQFVMTSDAIEAQVAKEDSAAEQKEEGFVDRLLALFK